MQQDGLKSSRRWTAPKVRLDNDSRVCRVYHHIHNAAIVAHGQRKNLKIKTQTPSIPKSSNNSNTPQNDVLDKSKVVTAIFGVTEKTVTTSRHGLG